jgi:hypothetical protein
MAGDAADLELACHETFESWRRFFDRGLSGSEEVTRFEAEHPLRLG